MISKIIYLFLIFISSTFTLSNNNCFYDSPDIEYELLSSYLNKMHLEEECLNIYKVGTNFSFIIEEKNFFQDLKLFLNCLNKKDREEILDFIIKYKGCIPKYSEKFKIKFKYKVITENYPKDLRKNSNLYVCARYYFSPVVFNKNKDLAFFEVDRAIGILGYELEYVIMKYENKKWILFKRKIVAT